MKYYIAENGQPAGPFEIDELLQHGLTVNSQVWNETMSGWTRAADVPELAQCLQQGISAPQTPPQDYQPQMPPATQSIQQPGYGQQPSPYAQPQYQQPQYQPQNQQYPQQAPYGQPYTQPQGFAPKNWMTESVILTVLSATCCCNIFSLITGIIAIVNASKVNDLFRRGDQNGAVEKAKQAKKWAIITLVVMLLATIISVIAVLTNPELMEAFEQGYAGGYSAI